MRSTPRPGRLRPPDPGVEPKDGSGPSCRAPSAWPCSWDITSASTTPRPPSATGMPPLLRDGASCWRSLAGRAGMLGSALAFAAAMAIRPHPFVPAAALASGDRRAGQNPGDRSRRPCGRPAWSIAVGRPPGARPSPRWRRRGCSRDFLDGLAMAGPGQVQPRHGRRVREGVQPAAARASRHGVPIASPCSGPRHAAGIVGSAGPGCCAWRGRPVSADQPHAARVPDASPDDRLVAQRRPWPRTCSYDPRRIGPTARLLGLVLILGLGTTIRPRFCNPKAAIEAVGLSFAPASRPPDRSAM